jgi:UDP-arabinose 4-epimerase
MNRILVSGGAGYIGSHTCKALAGAGYVPATFDNLSTGHRWAVKWGPLYVGDLVDRSAIDAAIADFKPAAILHFAGKALVAESVRDPDLYHRNNVVGSQNLIDAGRQAGIKAFVFSSSCATYGIPNSIPISEDLQQNPVNPYGASKLATERTLRDFDAAFGLRSVALRYFNAAGADPDAGIGEDHEPETHLIPLAIETALGRRPYVRIFGTDYPTPDGTAIRDYVHVTDLATAHVSAVQYLFGGGRTTALNLGTGRGLSVAEVIDIVEQIVGRPVPILRSLRRPGDPPELVASAGMAAQTLGWVAKHSAPNTIIQDACAWHVNLLPTRRPAMNSVSFTIGALGSPLIPCGPDQVD